MKPIIYIIFGIIIGVGSMMFINKWETVDYKRNHSLGGLGWDYSFVKKSSVGCFNYTFWESPSADGHALIIYSEIEPYHTITLTSQIQTNGNDEIISSIEIDDTHSFFGPSTNGVWKYWDYHPRYDALFSYEASSGIPFSIMNSDSYQIWVNNKFHNVDSNYVVRIDGKDFTLQPDHYGTYKLKANQRVDPTVKTPVELGNEQGTAGHP